jgi:hypothetical protein
MKYRILALFILSGVCLTITAGQTGTTKIYAGVNRCKVCHETTEMGDQYSVWANSKHAQAFQTLMTEEAVNIAKEWGLANLPHEAPECLTCHVTGYNDPDAEFGSKFDLTQGVQCESCHGPGEFYRKEAIMCDQDLAMENGLILPKPEDCLACHNEKSPRYKPFDYDEYYAKIEHHKNPDYECESEEDEDEEW